MLGSRFVRAVFAAVVIVIGLPVVAAPPAAAGQATPDPMAVGPFAVKKAVYDGGSTVVSDPQGATYPARIYGNAFYPAPGQAGGPFPVILLLHGNHGTCTIAGSDATGYPCPVTPVTADIPSYQGYDDLAAKLASDGYITLSLDANAVNTYNVAGDKGANERAQLLERTLDYLAARHTTAVVPADDVGTDLVGRVDLSRIGLMGHSRGGEGVSAFIEHVKTRTDGTQYTGLKAVFVLAGTDYGLPSTVNTNLATLLPLCDGDVYDLQSGFAWDRDRYKRADTPYSRTLYVVRGGNHNYFNTIWTGDDQGTGDSACDRSLATNQRLTSQEQRDIGYRLIAAHLRRFVGPEPIFDGWETGDAPLPAAACPTSTLPGGGLRIPCDRLVTTVHIAPAAQRTVIVAPVLTGDPLAVTNQGLPLTQTGFTTYQSCDPHADSGSDGGNRDPGTASGCATSPNRSRARQLILGWSSPAVLRAAVAPGTSAASTVLRLRVGYDFGDARNAGLAQDLDLVVEDAAGHRSSVVASAWSNALLPPDGTAGREVTMGGIRVPLTAFSGVDTKDIRAIEVRTRTPSGELQLSDLTLQTEQVTSSGDPAPTVPEAPAPVVLVVGAAAVVVGWSAVRRRRAAA